jgi:hypothetical protein
MLALRISVEKCGYNLLTIIIFDGDIGSVMPLNFFWQWTEGGQGLVFF